MRKQIFVILFLSVLLSFGCGSGGGGGATPQSNNKEQLTELPTSNNSNTPSEEKDDTQETPVDNVPSSNTGPEAKAGGDQAVSEGEVVTLDGSGSLNPEGNYLAYSWKQTSGIAVILNNSSSIRPIFTCPTVTKMESLMFELAVSDGNMSSKDTVNITINNNINEPPTANAGTDKDVTTGSVVKLNGASSSDPNGDPLTHQWILKSIPFGSATQLSSANTASPYFVPDIEGDYVIQLIVNDEKDSSSPDEVWITATKSKEIALKGSINTKVVYGKVHYLGQVINETDYPACFIEITVDSKDAQDKLIDTDFTYVDGSTMAVSDTIYADTCLLSGEVGGFEIYTALSEVPPKFVYVINFNSSNVSDPSVLLSQVIIDGQITETTDYFGNLKLMGFIKNLHPNITLQFVEISFVALKGDEVIDTDFTFINGSSCILNYGGTTDTCLAPGESRSFSVTMDVPPSEMTDYYYKINYDVLK